MSKKWILRTVKDEDGYVLLVCSEYDTCNYNYRYISELPDSIEEIMALAVHENINTWFGDWYESLRDDDRISIYDKIYKIEFKSIKTKINDLQEMMNYEDC